MTLLGTTRINKVLFHYRQARGDVPVIPELSTSDYSSTELAYIDALLTRCDTAFTDSSLVGGTLTDDSTETVLQDIVSVSANTNTTTTYGDRTTTYSSRPSYGKRLSYYFDLVQSLSLSVGFPLWEVRAVRHG